MNDYEDIEIVKGSGFLYRFYTRFPAMKMLQFNADMANVAKKEIYNSMLDNSELSEPVGYQMVSSRAARSWIFRDGFENPSLLAFLSNRIVEPLSKEAPPVLDALLQADEESLGTWVSEEITPQIPKNLGGLLDLLVERDLERKAGLNLLKRFFIKLLLPTPKTNEPITNSTESSAPDGTEEKTA